MDEQKELQTDSENQQTPIIPIPSGIPTDASIGIDVEQPVESFATELPKEPVPDIEIPTLRTYKNDINQTVNRDKISTAKILIAEQNRQRTTNQQIADTSIKRPTNIIVLILSIILIIVAVGGIGYFGYTKVVKKDIAPIVAPTTFLFVFDQDKFIDSSKDVSEIQDIVQKNIQEASSAKEGAYTDMIFYKTNQATKEKTKVTGLEFFKVNSINIPTNISRSLGKDFVYGVYTTQGKAQPFLVLSITDYETVYSSMFIWESTLALDIKTLFPVLKDLFDITKNKPVSTSVVAATSTATSTKISATTTSATTTELTPEQKYQQQIEQQTVINRSIRFLDTVFANKDARAVRDTNGTPFFYYAFIDKTKILFAQDPQLLNEISRKVKEKSLVR